MIKTLARTDQQGESNLSPRQCLYCVQLQQALGSPCVDVSVLTTP